MTTKPVIVGLGESLFDVFPDRAVLGGAPLNVAVQAHQLVAPRGGQGLPVSRIGNDELGERVKRELADRGISLEAIQIDPEHPTGQGVVTLKNGEPHFRFLDDAAWDHLQWSEGLQELAQRCHAVAFGTLGQRNQVARDTIRQFLTHARSALKVFDVNLRQSFYDAQVIRQSCELASVVKLNEHELPEVHRLLGLPSIPPALSDDVAADRAAEDILAGFGVRAVALTRGPRGTVLYNAGQKTEGEPLQYEPVDHADSVGAGDACTAGLIVGMLAERPASEIVDLANHLGAFVASQSGATPKLPEELIARAQFE